MSRKQQADLGAILEELTNSDRFKEEIRKCCESWRRETTDSTEHPTFAFEKAARYPWSVDESSVPIEGQKAVDDVADMLTSMIDHSMHEILNREFINVSSEILVMRE